MESIVFDDTTNAIRWRQMLVEPFINSLGNQKLTREYFQQEWTSAYTALTRLSYLEYELVY